MTICEVLSLSWYNTPMQKHFSLRQCFIVLEHFFGIVLVSITCCLVGYFIFFKTYTASQQMKQQPRYKITYVKIPTPTPLPTLQPLPTLIAQDTSPWGVATHIGGPLWEIKLGADARMGTAQEIFDALNHYRQVQAVGTLQWDQTLANYAQERAHTYTTLGKLDNHAGFNDFVTNQDGFHKLGYQELGENGALLTQPLLGVHIIEWLFASDPEHNANQLDSRWSAVGIGVDGLAIDVVFGGEKF